MIINIGYINNLIGSVVAGCFVSSVIGTLGSWSSPVVPKLQNSTSDNPFDEIVTETQLSWISSLVTLGAVIGCWFFGLMSDVVGRKIMMLTVTVPALVGYILMATIHKIEVFYLARLLQGTTIGGGFNLFIAYVGEISTKEIRGMALSSSAIFASIGSLFCLSVGPYVSITTLNIVNIIFPVACIAIGLIFCEESPYFYLLKNNEELARKALTIYRGPNYDFEEEIVEMKAHIKEQKETNVRNIITTKAYIKAFTIANVLLISQQFTGINAILFYSQSIFHITGSSLSPAMCSIILSAIQLFSGALSPLFLSRFGRIGILLTSGIGMAIFETILGTYCVLKDAGKDLDSLSFIPILCLTGFMLSYNFGNGPICWLIAGELYPAGVKMLSMSFTITLYNSIGFFITLYFNTVIGKLGIGVIFYFFSGCCLVACVFIKLYVFETKDISFEEIQDILNGKKREKLSSG